MASISRDGCKLSLASVIFLVLVRLNVWILINRQSCTYVSMRQITWSVLLVSCSFCEAMSNSHKMFTQIQILCLPVMISSYTFPIKSKQNKWFSVILFLAEYTHIDWDKAHSL